MEQLASLILRLETIGLFSKLKKIGKTKACLTQPGVSSAQESLGVVAHSSPWLLGYKDPSPETGPTAVASVLDISGSWLGIG